MSNDFKGAKRRKNYNEIEGYDCLNRNVLSSRQNCNMYPYFRCKGSTQHLKSTYGGGYVLEADVEPSTADIFDEDAIATQQKHVNELICERLFVDARCTEQFGRHCVYQIPRTSVKRLSEVFSALQQSKRS